MNDNVGRVVRWRKTTKTRLVDGFGGCCNKCGYSTCHHSLDLHHLDPSKKSFSFGKIMANPKKWNILVEEAKKCILLCKNCHSEFHAGYWKISDITIFEFKGEKNKFKKDEITGLCAICKKDVFMGKICCSQECAAKRSRKIDWPNKEEFEQMLKINSRVKVASILGVSDTAVKKRQIKLGII